MTKYYLISFRSRNLLMMAGNELKHNRIPYNIVSTPRNVGSVCTLSIKIESAHFERAIRLFRFMGIHDFSVFDMSTSNFRVY